MLDSLYSIACSTHSLLEATVFLVALASGFRASQLHALARHPAWLMFPTDYRHVSLAPGPGFVARNEREGRMLAPFVVSAWIEGASIILYLR